MSILVGCRGFVALWGEVLGELELRGWGVGCPVVGCTSHLLLGRSSAEVGGAVWERCGRLVLRALWELRSLRSSGVVYLKSVLVFTCVLPSKVYAYLEKDCTLGEVYLNCKAYETFWRA